MLIFWNKYGIKLNQIFSESYTNVFKLTYTNKVLEIDLTGTLPVETATIPLVLEATVDDKVQSSAVLDLEIIGKTYKTVRYIYE